uniref:Uncharacterized protein n=1 Tax=Aegilops tauschii subsp. strangulata TaxID=200361 RepID=A0A453PQ98_AEGTS
ALLFHSLPRKTFIRDHALFMLVRERTAIERHCEGRLFIDDLDRSPTTNNQRSKRCSLHLQIMFVTSSYPPCVQREREREREREPMEKEKTVVLYPGLFVSHFVPMMQLAGALLDHGYAVSVALIDPGV